MSTENKPNVPLLRKAVEWVEEQAKLPKIDREWNQSDWVQMPADKANNLAYEAAESYWLQTHPRESMFQGVDRFGLDAYKPEFLAIYNSFKDQLAPRCGTAYCVAGYVATIHAGQDLEGEYVDGVHVETYAQVALGLDPMDAQRLFAGGNDATAIRHLAERIAGEKL